MDEKETVPVLTNGLPQPPIPQRLRELLKDYPEHLERLQKVLNVVVEQPLKVTPPFERAVWMLEGQTEAFIREAQAELERAQAGGDPVAIGRAETREELMFSARSSNDGLGELDELWEYFQTYGDALK